MAVVLSPELEEKRGLWLRQQADGTFKVGGLLTAVQGAKWQAIAQTILSPRLPTFTSDDTDDGSDDEVSPVLADGRAREQLLADGFTAYIDRHHPAARDRLDTNTQDLHTTKNQTVAAYAATEGRGI
ncbi:hypothetical protein KPL76_10265 [Subtercola sp. PAMC28395]|uniref:hypothetical protein n=1 Tax=Subtercola sp. PAMC28395 TaxID=2846775 RepID=UPI001C0DE971|nr:hypothetical protein [Subtercola sp. PAMC28395]QWT23130.1 hypothetical protein KPL76_10265 [Subtercola sp. PAMC28395]